jgi:hypothetical protein
MNHLTILWQATRVSIVSAAIFAIHASTPLPKAVACDQCASNTTCGAASPMYQKCQVLLGECYNSNARCSS